jgi:hypothetical protein
MLAIILLYRFLAEVSIKKHRFFQEAVSLGAILTCA